MFPVAFVTGPDLAYTCRFSEGEFAQWLGTEWEQVLDLAEKLTGKFIVFDGPDGAGKGTQIARLSDALRAVGLEVVCTREPGGTVVGEQIREMLLGQALDVMDVRCEMLLFMASRAQLVGEVIEPAIKMGKTVLCDRFISATCAYQGAAGCDVKQIIDLGRLAIGGTWPDLTLVLDVPAEVGLARIDRHGRSGAVTDARDRAGEGGGDAKPGMDAMESRPIAFHRRVRELFLSLPRIYPRPVEVIDGTGLENEIHERILEVLGRVDF